jgi:hypothetical protein
MHVLLLLLEQTIMICTEDAVLGKERCSRYIILCNELQLVQGVPKVGKNKVCRYSVHMWTQKHVSYVDCGIVPFDPLMIH